MFFQQPIGTQVQLQHKLQMLGRQMRNAPTPAERILWFQLKGSQLGYKFRRQYPLFQFIVDFYCPAGKLVLELDGPIHEKQKDYDYLRDQYLQTAGYTVMRFKNSEVTHNIEQVVHTIQSHFSPARGDIEG